MVNEVCHGVLPQISRRPASTRQAPRPRIDSGRTRGHRRAHYERFIAPHYTTDGQADLAVGASAITAVAAELDVPTALDAAGFYRTTP
ncbi:hypothetical protein FHX82_005710 [Amycolatopsis bartoniae]|uniref:hypothetical protein n=1 Tax=Amycolatopsis bartoniae TaxID=941986 RepID=UPI0017C9F2D7|nr:hypothetical protein [Amycolatopsis bartoniae]MBB2938632.1 hypothetical protein [Amycolatopsis bartoniae]